MTGAATITELRDESVIELPTHFSKTQLYQQLVRECGFRLEYDSKHRVIRETTTNTGVIVTAVPGVTHKAYPSERSFREYWNLHHPNLKIPNARQDVCGDCYIFNNKHRFLSKLLKEAEIDEEDDAEEETEETMKCTEFDDLNSQQLKESQESLVLNAAKHVKMAREQRELFVTKKAEAVATRSLPRDQRKFCFVADYAQNLSIPSFCGEQPGETYYYTPLNAFVFGVADCSQVPTQMTAHTYLESESGKGGNNVASLLWKEFELKGLMSTSLGPPAEEINLFFDNCGGQNKNRMVLRLLHFMVMRKLCRTANAYFLVRGHTKNDCDRLFNLMKKEVRCRNIYTPKDLYSAIDAHEDVEAIPMNEDAFYDWDALQDEHMKRPPGVKSAHCFSVRQDNPNVMWIQEFIGGSEPVQHTLVKASFLENNQWFLKEPQDMPMKGIQNIKWMELHDKFRPLVPMEKWTEWLYYHTDLSQEARNEVKKHTKASKKQRKDRVHHNTKELMDATMETTMVEAGTVSNKPESNVAAV